MTATTANLLLTATLVSFLWNSFASPSPTDQRGSRKSFDPLSASTEVLLQHRRARLWDDGDDGNNSASSVPLTIEQWESKQLAGDAATVEMLLGSQGLDFSDRARAWLAWSGAAAARQQHPAGYYDALKKRWASFQQQEEGGDGSGGEATGTTSTSDADPLLPPSFRKSMDTVSRDLKRTCQEHQYFSDADGLECLERILATSLMHRPMLGYTQGMNYLAAFLLLTLQLGDDDDGATKPPARNDQEGEKKESKHPPAKPRAPTRARAPPRGGAVRGEERWQQQKRL